MKLASALRLDDGEIVAIMGPGDSTSALFRLADDLVESGGRVISTTLAPLEVAHLSRAPQHLSAFDANRARVEAALSRHAHVLLTGPVDHTLGHAAGVTPGLIEDLHAVPNLTAILVLSEAIVPASATRVVWVGDFDSAAVVVTSVSDVASRLNGGRVHVFMDRVETAEALTQARTLAAHLLQFDGVESVLLGAVHKPNAVREAHGRVAAVVLAAGRSTRMGRLKQLLPWGEHTTMLGAVMQRLRATSVADIVVVTGAERAAVEAALSDEMHADARVRCLFNPDFATSEMARSLQAGLSALPANRLAVLVALADQPQIEPAVVEQVMQRWRETQAHVVAPFVGQRRGHPMLFDRALWPKLMALPPEANPRDALPAAAFFERVPVETESILLDIDTPDDYAHAQP